jgi:hypothetical protein
MAKTKKGRSRSHKSQASTGVTEVPKKPDELQNARNRVTNVIVDASVDMTQRVVRSVNERGSVLALRFLWEIAGMFPTSAGGGVEEQESVAKSLIEKLGLYEEFPVSHDEGSTGKGDVESESS